MLNKILLSALNTKNKKWNKNWIEKKNYVFAAAPRTGTSPDPELPHPDHFSRPETQKKKMKNEKKSQMIEQTTYENANVNFKNIFRMGPTV
jgi:hypothetical protein